MRLRSFRDHTRRLDGKPGARDAPGERDRLRDSLDDLIDRIEGGIEVPEDYYSRRVDDDNHTDQLLAVEGVMHLHLGGRGSNILLYLVQFADRVVLLEINDHKYVTTRTNVANPAGNLMAQHRQPLEADHRVALSRQPASNPAASGAVTSTQVADKSLEGEE